MANATVELPEEIVRARGMERWERVERQMAGQGMNPDTYLQMQGKTRDEIIDESLPDAEQEIRREAVLVAVADAEEIEVSDEEMESELEHMASHERTIRGEAARAAQARRPPRDGRRRHPGAQGDRPPRRDAPSRSRCLPKRPIEKLWTPGDPR